MESRKALVARESAGLFPSAQQWQTMSHIADTLITSGLLPQHVKTPQAALAIMLNGSELGVPAMQALSSIVVVQGKPTCNAELMLALVYRDHGDDAMIITQTTASSCSMSYKRRGWKERQTYSFTMEDAQRAGLAESQTWRKYPAAMLRARAVSAVARMAFPDSIAGMYVYEEMGLPVEEEGGEQVVVGETERMAGTTTGAVLPATPPASPEQQLDEGESVADSPAPERVASPRVQSGPTQAEQEQTQKGQAPSPPRVAGQKQAGGFAKAAAAALVTEAQTTQRHTGTDDAVLSGLRAEVVALLEHDGAALDLLKTKGTLPPDMTQEQLCKTRDWLLQREQHNVHPSVRLGRQIDAAGTPDVLRALQQEVQTAKDQRVLSQAEYVSVLRDVERRRNELSGPLTAGSASVSRTAQGTAR